MPGWGVTKFDKTPRMPPERQRIAIGGSGGYIVLRLYGIGGGGSIGTPGKVGLIAQHRIWCSRKSMVI